MKKETIQQKTTFQQKLEGNTMGKVWFRNR